MKKNILFTLFIMLCLCSVGQPKLGIVAGGVFAKTSGVSSKFRAGAYAGIQTDVKLGKSVSLTPQLKYIMKGETITPEGKGNYNYLEIPVNFVYYIPTNAGRFSVGGGPSIAYMMSGSWTRLDGSKETIDFEYDKVSRLDFGLNVVAGFEIKRHIFFTIHYTYGLADVWTADYIGKNANRVIGLGAGIML